MDDGVRWMLDAMVRCVRAVRMEKKIFFFSRERRVKECNDVGSWKSVVRGT